MLRPFFIASAEADATAVRSGSGRMMFDPCHGSKSYDLDARGRTLLNAPAENDWGGAPRW